MSSIHVTALLIALGTPPETHHEVQSDAPVAPSRQRGAPAAVQRGDFASVQVNVDARGDNIVGDAANEPSIAIDPLDPMRAVIGWRQFDSIQSNFRQAGYGWTDDGGATWTFPGVLEPGVFRSDPVLDVDADGRFYYNSLFVPGGTFMNSIHVSEDGGRTFDLGTLAWGGDKQWMAIDRTGGIGHGNIYANWTRQFSSCDGQFTWSSDGGVSYEGCVDVPGEPRWGTIAIDSEGVVYIASTAFNVVRSSTLRDRDLPAQFDFVTTVEMGGTVGFGVGPNPGGLAGQAWLGVDVSGGERDGYVYMLASVNPPGGDPMDVMIVRSEDGGVTWSTPVRVNEDAQHPDSWQWFGTLAVAPNGRLDAVWIDTRTTLAANLGELRYTFSEDGGRTWAASMPVSPTFDSWVGWPAQNKIGDYYDMVSDDRAAHLAYSATFNGEQDVYYLEIEAPVCPDFDDDGAVTFADLLSLLGAWGPCADCVEDLDGDQAVGFTDLVELLSKWGSCPLTCCLPADRCADAPELASGQYAFSTLVALTDGENVPAVCDEGGGVEFAKDVWVRYVAPCSGTATVSACGSDFDARLAIYTTEACPGELIACSDDMCAESPEVTFPVAGGAVYLVRIGGSGERGTGTLVLSCSGG